MNRSARIRLALAVSVTLVFLVLFLRGVHWGGVWEALLDVRFGWLLLAIALSVCDYFMRAVRWIFLVRHVDRNVSLDTLWRGTAIGSALNTFMPFRGGDLVRPAYVASKRGMPFTTLLSTTVVERLLDLFGFVTSLLVMLVMIPPSMLQSAVSVGQLRRWGAVGAVAVVGGLALMAFLATRRAREAVMLIVRPWPYPVRMRVMRFYLQLSYGLEAGGHPLRLLPAAFATLVTWTFTAALAWASFRALGVQAGPALGVFVAVAMTAAIAVPQAPGFLGLFQVATEQAALLWGVSQGQAEA